MYDPVHDTYATVPTPVTDIDDGTKQRDTQTVQKNESTSNITEIATNDISNDHAKENGGQQETKLAEKDRISEEDEIRKPIRVGQVGNIPRRKADDPRPAPRSKRPHSPSPGPVSGPTPSTTLTSSSKRQKRPTIQSILTPEQRERERMSRQREEDEKDRRAVDQARFRTQEERVRAHYNARPNQAREVRQLSPIVKLRNFNNWIKSILIQKFASEKERPYVLDLGCGKGGDLLKWQKARTGGYIGIDAAEVSIEQARERYRRMRHPGFQAKFYAADCFSNPLSAILPPDEQQFDIVTLQFCLHYAFESEAQARTMLQNVSKALPRHGKFIGTIPSSDAIVKSIEGLGPNETGWGNSIYNVTFDAPAPLPTTFRPPFGHKYTFSLTDAVQDVPEYVVPFEALRALAEEYNLELVYRKGFHEVYREEKDGFEAGTLLDRMGVVKANGMRGIEGDEAEAAGFYLAFCFEKRGV